MLLLGAATFSAKAALFVNSNAGCRVTLVFYAHDAANTTTCSYYSTRLEVYPGNSFAYNNVTNMNSPGLGWYRWGFGAQTLVAANSGWDGVMIYSDYAPTTTIGAPGSCGASTSFSSTGTPCDISATWTALGGGNVLLEIN
ncbi:hypothetical protein B0I18_103240 [Taibaiella chishuiensis]|uniref:Uncharacterized protein n=2 Tax=Taibaiella chishuiensis TaxID=1434707 RepID=A0A2P8D617_9BACT|nr:hypothetical protein B0I18_103240 [Taibaiella chishuiensis]